MEDEEPEMEKEKIGSKISNFDRSDLISVFALILSLAAFGATLYEANILKQQQVIMQAEQKASFWPYLEIKSNFNYSESSMEHKISITNKGVGPAIIEHFEIQANGSSVNEYFAMTEALKAFYPNSDQLSLSLISPRGILSPGETYVWLKFKKESNLEELSQLKQIKLDYKVCYKNIFGEYWTVTSSNDEPQSGCFALEKK